MKADEAGGIFKFVRLTTGEWRFWKGGTTWCAAHVDMVKEGEKAEAAGTIGNYIDHFRLVQSYSSTLGVAVGEGAARELQKLLGTELKGQYGDPLYFGKPLSPEDEKMTKVGEYEQGWRPEQNLKKDAERMLEIIFDPKTDNQEAEMALTTLLGIIAPKELDALIPDEVKKAFNEGDDLGDA